MRPVCTRSARASSSGDRAASAASTPAAMFLAVLLISVRLALGLALALALFSLWALWAVSAVGFWARARVLAPRIRAAAIRCFMLVTPGGRSRVGRREIRLRLGRQGTAGLVGALQHLPEITVTRAVMQLRGVADRAQSAASAATMMRVAVSISRSSGEKASRMGWICEGWMLHMRA